MTYGNVVRYIEFVDEVAGMSTWLKSTKGNGLLGTIIPNFYEQLGRKQWGKRITYILFFVHYKTIEVNKYLYITLHLKILGFVIRERTYEGDLGEEHIKD